MTAPRKPTHMPARTPFPHHIHRPQAALGTAGRARTLYVFDDPRCTISLVSTGPQLVPPPAPTERNWIPLAVAAAILLAIAGGLFAFSRHGKNAPEVTSLSAPLDPYAAQLAVGNLAMSESANLSGGKVTYLDGQIANRGVRTVTAIVVQVLFHDAAGEVAWNETQPLRLIRTRQPYVDLEPVSAAPLKPGDRQAFRLVFDAVPDQWDGAYPVLRIVHVETR